MSKVKIFLKDNIVGAIVIGIIISLAGNYLWDRFTEFSKSKKALNEQLYFRNEFKSDDLKIKEIKTNRMIGNEQTTRIVLVQNFNYFDNVSWFSLAKDSGKFPDTYSGVLFYDMNQITKDYELVYKFIPLDVAKENFLPGAVEQNLDQVPLLLSSARLGDIDLDGKADLITHWSYCNFNHCVWDYPIIFSYDAGYFVKWTMPKHKLSDHDIKHDYNWGGQLYEREVVNIHDNRHYKINGGNYIQYKFLDNEKIPSVVSYNIDNYSCWACTKDQTFLLDIFPLGKTFSAIKTFHQSKGLEQNFTEIRDYEFVDFINFDE